MEVITIKVHVSKDAAIAQGATEWGDSSLALTPLFAAKVRAENDLALTRCFLDETHNVSTPTLEAAFKAAQGVRAARNCVVYKLIANAERVQSDITRPIFNDGITCTHGGRSYNLYEVNKYGTPAQIAELAALEKIWNAAKTAQAMEAYRESAARFFAGELNGVSRSPSLIGIDPELDAKVNAHTQALLATDKRLRVLRESAIRDINRAIVAYAHGEGSTLLKQFDEDQLRDSEILETIAGWARDWVVRGRDLPPDGTMITRIRADDLERIRPTPREFIMLRSIEHVGNEDWSTRAVFQRLVQSPLVAATVKVSARLCTWSDWENGEEDAEGNPKSYRAIEVGFTVETTTQDIPSAKEVRASETWTVYFRLPSV